MAEQTVRDRLLAALERIEALAEPDPDWPVSADSLLNTARRIAHDNLERARVEPDEHFPCRCDGPDCPTWQAGYEAGTEAQREPPGRGTA